MEVRDHPALRSALITYLGNKRRLLSFISRGITAVARELGTVHRFAEPFAGSGVVGRMARLGGLSVHSNDIEDYTRPLGRTFLELDPAEVETHFARYGGYRQTLEALNELSEPGSADHHYFSRHYAPADTATADPDSERLFFTRENALRLDAMLEQIHSRFVQPARDVLLAGVLIQMSIHNNTSGVMKGYHRGWGGRGGDALSRILAPMTMDPLPFITGPRGVATVGDAADVFADRSLARFDLAYLDPPYTIHQYGANYHLLTSAVRWDGYDPGPVDRGSRAGIRRDHVRSEFCRRSGDRARNALAQTLNAINARALIVSYNNDGIIPPEDIVRLLSDEGANTVLLMKDEYTKYRGGKGTQSALNTTEYLYLAIKGRRQSRNERDAIVSELREHQIVRAIRDAALTPERWQQLGGQVEYSSSDRVVLSDMRGNRLVLDSAYRVTAIEDCADVEALFDLVERCRADKVEVCRALIDKRAYGSALEVLQTLKIAAYRQDFIGLASALDRCDLSPTERQRLDGLSKRVLT